MKKILFVLMLFVSIGLYAQEKSVYCDVAGRSNMKRTNFKIEVDYGQPHRGEYDATTLLVDDSGNELEFNSMAHVANYMADRGWRIVSSYQFKIPTLRGEENEIHYVMEKNLKDGESITDGLKFKK